MTGYRFISQLDGATRPEVGTVLPVSYVWHGDEQTDRQLDGTCAFATLAACVEYARWSTGWIVRIEGERVRNHRSNRRVAGEIVLADAVVKAIVSERIDPASAWAES
jgi:hypothetical protein